MKLKPTWTLGLGRNRADLELVRRDRGALAVVLREGAIHPVTSSGDAAVGCRHLGRCTVGDGLRERTAHRLRLASGDRAAVARRAEQRSGATRSGVARHVERAAVVDQHVVDGGDLDQQRLGHDRRRRCRGGRRGAASALDLRRGVRCRTCLG